MPSFTDPGGDSGPEIEGLQPILGTGLNVPLQKTRPAAAHSNGAPPPAATAAAPEATSAPRKHRASVSKKLAARPPVYNTPSLTSQTSGALSESGTTQDDRDASMKPGDEDPHANLLSQVYEWLRREKHKTKAHKLKKTQQSDGTGSDGDDDVDEDPNGGVALERTLSQGSSCGSSALDKLETILLQHAAGSHDGSGLPFARRLGRRRKGLRRGSASESDYAEVDAAPPSVDAVLDNSKTLAYSGGGAEDDDGENGASAARRAKDREAWTTFKNEILRLAHTLQLKGWRKLPADLAGDIEVIRLSGALTNAVYVVNSPARIPPSRAEDGSYTLVNRKPPKLLLRVYGPQVDHLIDREKELQILRRLGRKNIGPKVLGTFNNGRFEEYFEARPLTPDELRDPGIMVQIAKRMRELHDGIDLLDEEREGGPMVFRNWDKWVDRCEQVINWLDKEIQSPLNEAKAVSEPWRRRGFVCGVSWPTFRKAVENYRQWLVERCGGIQQIKQHLVFAHNDTQYGNLLRMEPSSESPLLRPENKHKQLVVIDFEYAQANTPGFEFANHFTEWCYNYHDPEKSWHCNNKRFPTPEQQRRFITSYLTHDTGFKGATSPSITPLMRGASSNLATLAPLDLDAPDADPQAADDVERAAEDKLESDTRTLMQQTRLWRVINSAQWVAWGIVQAKVPGMEEGIAADAAAANGHALPTEEQQQQQESRRASSSAHSHSNSEGEDDDDEFDYLAYSQDRALFFWSDLLAMGLIGEEELPAEMVQRIKGRIIEY